MTKIEKLARECASGKHGDAYDAANCACLEMGDWFKEYLEKKQKELDGTRNKSNYELIDEIINEFFKED